MHLLPVSAFLFDIWYTFIRDRGNATISKLSDDAY